MKKMFPAKNAKPLFAALALALIFLAPCLVACHRGSAERGTGDTSAVKQIPDSSAQVDSMINKAADTLKAH